MADRLRQQDAQVGGAVVPEDMAASGGAAASAGAASSGEAAPRSCAHEVVRIERMSYGPCAVGHLSSGKAVFVAGAAPGDVAEIEVYEEKKRFARARVARVVQPSDARVREAVCPLAGGACGGCPWAHLAYEAQCEAKRQVVLDALVRTARLDKSRAEDIVEPCLPCKRPWGYRNKLELAVGNGGGMGGSMGNSAGGDANGGGMGGGMGNGNADGNGMGNGADGADGVGGRLVVGLRREGARDIAPLDSCPLACRLIESAPKALRGVLRYLQSDKHDLGVYRVGIRASLRTNDIEAALWTPPGDFPRAMAARTLADALHTTSVVRVLAVEGSARAVRKVEVLGGRGYWEERLGDVRMRASAPSFFQVNTAQAEHLVDFVVDALEIGQDASVGGMYAGVGTFSVPLAQAGASVIAVEQAGSSVRDLRRNAEVGNVDIDVVCGDAAHELAALDALDALVVDPPRTGLARAVVDAVAAVRPPRVAYVSCDPQTWARDVALLEDRGFRLMRAVPVDMFPQTYHVEVASVFTRKG